MIQIVPYPPTINVIARVIGSTAFIILGLKCLAIWRRTKEDLMLYFGFSVLVIGTSGYMLLGTLFTHNLVALRYLLLTGLLIEGAGVALLSLVEWLVVFHRRFSYLYILVPALILETTTWILYAAHPTVNAFKGWLYVWHGSQLASDIYGLTLLLIVYPMAYAFIIQGLKTQELGPRLKAFGIVAICLGIGASESINAFFFGRNDSVPSSLIDLVIYTAFLLIVLYPTRYRTPENSPR